MNAGNSDRELIERGHQLDEAINTLGAGSPQARALAVDIAAMAAATEDGWQVVERAAVVMAGRPER